MLWLVKVTVEPVAAAWGESTRATIGFRIVRAKSYAEVIERCNELAPYLIEANGPEGTVRP